MKRNNSILIHDIITITCMLPFAFMCLLEVIFNFKIYPLFLTHTLMFHMVYDVLWIIIQPSIVPSMRGFIITHHIAIISLLVYPLLSRPQDAHLTALSGIIEFDTCLLLLKRVSHYNEKMCKIFHRLYLISNVLLRVFYETYILAFFWNYFKNDVLLIKIHALGGQLFITLFSYGICIFTYTKRNPALKPD